MELAGVDETTTGTLPAHLEVLKAENKKLNEKIVQVGWELTKLAAKKTELEVKLEYAEKQYEHLLGLVIDKI